MRPAGDHANRIGIGKKCIKYRIEEKLMKGCIDTYIKKAVKGDERENELEMMAKMEVAHFELRFQI